MKEGANGSTEAIPGLLEAARASFASLVPGDHTITYQRATHDKIATELAALKQSPVAAQDLVQIIYAAAIPTDVAFYAPLLQFAHYLDFTARRSIPAPCRADTTISVIAARGIPASSSNGTPVGKTSSGRVTKDSNSNTASRYGLSPLKYGRFNSWPLFSRFFRRECGRLRQAH